VKEGVRLHGLYGEQAEVFAGALSFLTFMSAGLKERTGEVSLSIKTDGKILDLCASGNADLKIRGYLDWNETAQTPFGNGALTLVRDDGYSRPFVGACGLIKEGSLDENFEEYFRASEQLPTFIATNYLENADGTLEFSGIIVLQPLPFASESALKKIPNHLELKAILQEVKKYGALQVASEKFGATEGACSLKNASYTCNCSREYLKGVLVSLGENEFRNIIKEDGAVRVHCHYCNTDYAFTDEDADLLFAKK
jgi:molecular chaperone Hsp33